MKQSRIALLVSILLGGATLFWLRQTPPPIPEAENAPHEQAYATHAALASPDEAPTPSAKGVEQILGGAPEPASAIASRTNRLDQAQTSPAQSEHIAAPATPARLLTPTEAQNRVFPPINNARLAENLQEPQRVFRESLRLEFPSVDVTEVQQYHGMISDKRATFGPELTDETVDAYRKWMSGADALHREMVRLRAEEHGLSLGGMDEEGRGYALIGFEDGRPVYTYTSNVSAARSTGANLVRWNANFDPALGATIDGSGLYVNINDHGTIYEHREFQLPNSGGSRIMVKQVNDSGDRNHMTHVAGTVTAWGYSSSLLGMAPRAWIRSLIFQNNSHVTTYGMRYPGEMHDEINPRTSAQQQKSVLGNTSLQSGYDGLYSYASQTFDIVLRDFPYYVHFYSAGNYGSSFETMGRNQPMSKSVMAIGAVNDVSRDTDGNYTSGGGIASFSSRGPTFDGRIKPDFTATGVSVTSSTGTTGSSTWQGTSMSSPNAAGSALLLIDYVQQRFPGHFFRSSTYKSLLMTTATDLGNPGPDYTYGWGVVNVHHAGKIIRHHAENSYDRVLLEERLHPGQVWTYSYTNSGSGPIRASLAWIDVPGAVQTTNDTPRTSAVVNDLDMRIIGPDDTVFYPYVMPYVTGRDGTPAFSSSLRGAWANRGDNFTDPAEQILINNPAAGIYTVQISHKGSLDSGLPQPFSFSVTGLRSATAAPAIITAVTPAEGNNTDDFPMAVLGSGFVLGSDVFLRRHGSPVVQAYRIIPVGDRIDFRVNTAGIEKGYYDVVVRAPDGTESVLPNGFLMPITGSTGVEQTIYANTFANANGLTLTGNWAVGAPNQSSVGGPGSAFTGTQVLGTYLSGNYENNINIVASLPPISTGNRDNIKLTFRRWLGLAYNQSGAVSSRHRDDGRIHYSLDGSTWTQVWESNAAFNESSWSQQTINLPSAVNNQSQVFIRFQLQTDGSEVSYGWNIDDLRVTGVSATVLPPLFTSQPVTTATQNVAYAYTVTTSDEDTPGSGLTLQASGLPAGISFVDHGNGTGQLSGTPSMYGLHEVTLSVTDGHYTTRQIFDLLVYPEGNSEPLAIVTESIPDASEGQAYTALIEAQGGDWLPRTFSVSTLPGGLSFTDNGNGTATISGTPNVGGTFSITVTVTNGPETDQETYSLSVNPRPFVGFTESSVEVQEDIGSVTVYVARTLNDAGAVSVNYATQNGLAIAGTDYEAVSGTLTWADGELGSKPITITIMGDDFTREDRDFRINLSTLSSIATMGTSALFVTILDKDDNAPPEIALHTPTSRRFALPPGVGLLVSGTVTDDGQPSWGSLTQGWTVTSKPVGATVNFTDESDINTGVTFSHEGSYRLQFTADDGEFSDSLFLQVEVTEELSASLPTENMALWLPLDEHSGTSASDASGNGRNASLAGDPTWQPAGGVQGGALQFTATGQRGEIANSANLNNVAQMSWAMWLRPSATVTSDLGIMGKRTSSSGGDRDWGFWMPANKSNRITVDVGASRVELAHGIPANEWTHVAFVYDGTRPETERMSVYYNGEFKQYVSIAASIIPNRNVNVALGTFQLGDNRNFIGLMDEVVIYLGRALTVEEVVQIMNGGALNRGPIVNIQPVLGAQEQQATQLYATVEDDALSADPGALTVLWEQEAGPVGVVFSDPAIVDTQATFPVPGTYTLRLSADDGAIRTYATVEVVVGDASPFAPVILIQPEAQIVYTGTPFSFAVVAVGNPTPTYQWFRNGTPISGATGANYSIAASQLEHAGTYIVRVSNDEGEIDSTPVELRVVPPPAQLPFHEDFDEPGKASILGPLDGQYGWMASSGAIVEAGAGRAGSKGLALAAGHVEQGFTNGTNIVAVSIWAKLVGVEEPDTPPAGATAVFWVDTNNYVRAFNHDAVVVTTAQVNPAVYNHFEAWVNYDTDTWRLDVNGTNVLNNFGTYSSQSAFTKIRMESGASDPAYFDDIQITSSSPFETPTINLTITTGRPGVGLLTPPVGTYAHAPGEWVEASVAGSPAEQDGTRHTVTGWTRTDSTATSGTGTNVTFQLNENTILHWDWETHHWIELRTQRE
jgi:hypothetical protein